MSDSNKTVGKTETVKPISCDQDDAAKFLGVPVNSLRKSRSTGLLYGVKAPEYKKTANRVFYQYAVLEEWLKNLPTFENSAQEQNYLLTKS
jgi:hypothetical protein